MNKCTELRKYAFPDSCLIDFISLVSAFPQKIKAYKFDLGVRACVRVCVCVCVSAVV